MLHTLRVILYKYLFGGHTSSDQPAALRFREQLFLNSRSYYIRGQQFFNSVTVVCVKMCTL